MAKCGIRKPPRSDSRRFYFLRPPLLSQAVRLFRNRPSSRHRLTLPPGCIFPLHPMLTLPLSCFSGACFPLCWFFQTRSFFLFLLFRLFWTCLFYPYSLSSGRVYSSFISFLSAPFTLPLFRLFRPCLSFTIPPRYPSPFG